MSQLSARGGGAVIDGSEATTVDGLAHHALGSQVTVELHHQASGLVVESGVADARDSAHQLQHSVRTTRAGKVSDS
jgi:hypothetical protein